MNETGSLFVFHAFSRSTARQPRDYASLIALPTVVGSGVSRCRHATVLWYTRKSLSVVEPCSVRPCSFARCSMHTK